MEDRYPNSVFVKSNGKTFPLEGTGETTIRELKERYYAKVGERPRFFCGGKVLDDDDRTLDSYGVTKNWITALHVAVQPTADAVCPDRLCYGSEATQPNGVSVKTLWGMAITLKADTTTTVRELKEQYCAKEGTTPDQIRMGYANKLFDDDNRTVDSYGALKERQIWVLPILRRDGAPAGEASSSTA